MKLRQKSKRDQTLDAAASVAKTWSEWRLGEKVARTASKAAKTTKKAKKARSSSGGPGRLKIAGAIAVLGGIGAAVAKKLSGGKAEPLYTPPGPAADMAAPPTSPVAVGDLAGGAPPSDMPAVPPTVEPALTASTETPEPDPSPVVVEDLVSDAPGAAEADEAPPAVDEPPSTTDVPSSLEDLASADVASAEPGDDEDKAY